MPKHEQYEQLCVLATIGEATATELDELKKHLDACADCRRDYKEFTESVLPQLLLADEVIPAFIPEASEHDGNSVRSRFNLEAQMAGISLSREALNPTVQQLAIARDVQTAGRSWNWIYRAAVAAALIVAAACGYYAAIVRAAANVRTGAASAKTAKPANERTVQLASFAAVAQQSQAAAHNTDDTKKITGLELELASLEQQFKDVRAQLEIEQTKAARVESERGGSQDQVRGLRQQVAAAELQEQVSQQTAADLRAQLDRSQEQANLTQASFIADEVKIKTLNGQLEEQKASLEHTRELLSAGPEISNLLAERNLHIVDVYDTDGEGKTKPIFGRIFLTGNKRLIFYAYDLNESRLDRAKYTYRVWGEKQGPGESAKALGAFNADDKTQKRWVFKYEDAKVLSQIDCVFVTFEPTAKSPDHPRGQKLMYAYLRGEVNHP